MPTSRDVPPQPVPAREGVAVGGDPSAGRDLAARLSRVESRNVTHLAPPPPFWAEARGACVRDAEGREYLDFTGAFGVAFAGHRHPKIMARIARQSERLVHGMGDVHPPRVKLEFLEALADLMPWPETRIVLGLSGSGAVEAALKTAHLATGRPGIVAFEGGYHGLTLGALAATHREHFRRPFMARLADHVRFVPFPETDKDARHSLEAVDRALAGGVPVPVGTVLVEPVQGRAGVRVPPDGFLEALGRRARSTGALLVADEVFTGMGRTGSVLASAGAADLVCLGKALGGGLPLSACCGPQDVMDAWPPSSGEAVHTETFLGHPLCCAAGLGFLEVVEEEGLIGRARCLGEQALDRLRASLAGCDRVAGVRGRGLMLGVELTDDGTGTTVAGEPERVGGRAGSDERPGPGVLVARRALERGLLVLPAGEGGQVVELTPPATITEAELARGLDALAEVVRSL